MTIAVVPDGNRVAVAVAVCSPPTHSHPVRGIVVHLSGGIMAANGYSRPGTEFWADAISAVKGAYPDFQVMGEARDRCTHTTLHIRCHGLHPHYTPHTLSWTAPTLHIRCRGFQQWCAASDCFIVHVRRVRFVALC